MGRPCEVAFLLGQTALQVLTWEDKGCGPQLVQVSEPLELGSVHDSNTCGALQQQAGCDGTEQVTLCRHTCADNGGAGRADCAVRRACSTQGT